MLSYGDNFSDNDKADEEQGVDQQTGDEQPIDYHHYGKRTLQHMILKIHRISYQMNLQATNLSM